MTKTVAIDNSEPIIEEQTGINVELLNRVADHIEANYYEFNMDHWMKTHTASWWEKVLAAVGLVKKPFCGTTACIAGWTCTLSGKRGDNIPAEAQKLLGITLDQAQRLFYVHKWPKQFKKEYISDMSYANVGAWVAAERIRHFIATNGAE